MGSTYRSIHELWEYINGYIRKCMISMPLWQLLLEEFGPEFVHVKGIHNTVAHAIRCIDTVPPHLVQENYMLMINTKDLCTQHKL